MADTSLIIIIRVRNLSENRRHKSNDVVCRRDYLCCSLKAVCTAVAFGAYIENYVR